MHSAPRAHNQTARIPWPPGDHRVCPYCGDATVIRDSDAVYGRSYGVKVLMCSAFPVCDSYVGCHQGTEIPKGTLANKELRDWRMQAHAVFDPLWRGRTISRRQAYQQLAKILHVPASQAHIAWCTIDQCKLIIQALKAKASRV